MMPSGSPAVTDEMDSLPLSDSHPADAATSAGGAASFPDPPSYADVVFDPFDPHKDAAAAAAPSESGSFPINGSSPRSARAGASDYLMISVSDPELMQETANSLVAGGATYVTYLIVTQIRPSAANDEPLEYAVRRRFRDVVTLAARLSEAYRGYVIPQRPDKGIVDGHMMQKHEFVEQRRRELEKYLWKLAEHPVIGRSEELRVFLQAQGKLPLPATTDVTSRVLDGAVRLPKQLFGEGTTGQPSPEDVTQPAKEGRDLLRIFKELKQAVTNDWGGVKPLVVEEDKEFLDRKEKMHNLEQQLSKTSLQAEALVTAQQDIGDTMGDLGMSFIKLTKFETEVAMFNSHKMRAADAKSVATAAVKASRLLRELNAHTVKHLTTLHDHLGVLLAVQSAFSDRASALLTIQTLMSDLSSLHVRVDKLEAQSSKIFGGDQSRIRKVEELKGTIKVTEDAKSCALKEYERIKENNRTEFERLDRERHDDLLSMVKGFVISQVGYWEKIGHAWVALTEETSCYATETK